MSPTALIGGSPSFVIRRLIRGLPIEDLIINNPGIVSESDLRVLASSGASQRVLRLAAGCQNADPAAAVDYSCSGAIAKILLEASTGQQVFALYSQSAFTRNKMPLSLVNPGRDTFRRESNVLAVLTERIMHGGDVLPDHIVKWYNAACETGFGLILRSRESDGLKIEKCLEVYRAQCTPEHEQYYDFMVAYHSYHKYFPVYMYVKVQGKNISPAKKRRHNSLLSEDKKKRDLFNVVVGASRMEDIMQLVLSYLDTSRVRFRFG